MRRHTRINVSVFLCLFAVTLTSCLSLEREESIAQQCDSCPALTGVCHDPSMRRLGSDLDRLQHHIEQFGSATAKSPDVWGEARLTKYRQEFEALMASKKGEFQRSLQGYEARMDQSLFVNAMALSAAASGNGATTSYPAGTYVQNGTTMLDPVMETYSEPILDANGKPVLDPDGKPLAKTRTIPKDTRLSLSPASIPGEILTTVNSANFTNPSFNAALARFPGYENNQLGISLEPTRNLAQMKRYLDCLNQIRRTNEGDDIADTPGYALNLVRIPVSLLPGKCTDKGYGAEITMSLSPILRAR